MITNSYMHSLRMSVGGAVVKSDVFVLSSFSKFATVVGLCESCESVRWEMLMLHSQGHLL